MPRVSPSNLEGNTRKISTADTELITAVILFSPILIPLIVFTLPIMVLHYIVDKILTIKERRDNE